MRVDLAAARKVWLQEAETDPGRVEREKSDFLKYKDYQGRFADFHANRHTFISNLSKANVAPKVTQSLARHSDIRITMGAYTHLDLADHTNAIDALPAPPKEPHLDQQDEKAPAVGVEQRAADGSPQPEVVPYTVPRGAHNGARQLPSKTPQAASDCSGEADLPSDECPEECEARNR